MWSEASISIKSCFTCEPNGYLRKLWRSLLSYIVSFSRPNFLTVISLPYQTSTDISNIVPVSLFLSNATPATSLTLSLLERPKAANWKCLVFPKGGQKWSNWPRRLLRLCPPLIFFFCVLYCSQHVLKIYWAYIVYILWFCVEIWVEPN